MAPRFSLVWRGPGGREDRHLDDDRGVDEVVCAERRREPGAVGLPGGDDVADVADLLFVVVIYEERDGLAVRRKRSAWDP
jgi:hypothetical protein